MRRYAISNAWPGAEARAAVLRNFPSSVAFLPRPPATELIVLVRDNDNDRFISWCIQFGFHLDAEVSA